MPWARIQAAPGAFLSQERAGEQRVPAGDAETAAGEVHLDRRRDHRAEENVVQLHGPGSPQGSEGRRPQNSIAFSHGTPQNDTQQSFCNKCNCITEEEVLSRTTVAARCGRPVGAGLRPRPVFRGVDGCCNRICRGEPACSPVDGSREAACPGGHIGPPLRDGGGVREPTGIGVKTDLANGAGRSPPPTGGPGRQAAGMSRGRRGVVTPPYGSATGGVQRRADVGIGPYERRASRINHPGQRRTAKRLRRGCEGMGGNRGRDHPQRGHQRRTIPQSACG